MSVMPKDNKIQHFSEADLQILHPQKTRCEKTEVSVKR